MPGAPYTPNVPDSILARFKGSHPYAIPYPTIPAPQPLPLTVSEITALPPAPAEAPVAVPQAAPAAPVGIYDIWRYGDALTIPVIYTGAASVLALQRPTGRRVWLLIENTTSSTIRFNFDADASATVGFSILANGNAWWDTVVPQNNIYIYSPGAGTVQLAYINAGVPTVS